ncbi:hypothetical protein HanOQP8_Chr15g0560831 [Helianthus annuus]|nr:hypothetical protein HanOQP8_Chr15g0560831 [Helianthus annuus]
MKSTCRIWLCRVERIFSGKASLVQLVMEKIKAESYWWAVKRAKIIGLVLEKWSNLENLGSVKGGRWLCLLASNCILLFFTFVWCMALLPFSHLRK